ncbi:F-box domain-containing protein [Mycena chlorophos]|uniref:F-box domain-containing protein n=1 Tax=Mycena chlorophos TaxID=658473 RepID=A0A8H6SBB3_MYCCL|nr:F-box domain-containing protein [Mycena chlorophos]
MSGPLSSLSVELVQEIAAYLDTHDQAAVRATCSALSAALDPLLFSALTLNIRNESLEQDLSRLRALGDGTTPYSHYARDLHIKQLTPYFWNPKQDPNIADREAYCHSQLDELLKPALESLRVDKLQSVRWVGSSYERPSVVEILLDTLAKFQLRDVAYTFGAGLRNFSIPAVDRLSGPSLKGFQVIILGRPRDRLDPIHRLLHRSPNLTTLSLLTPPDIPYLEEIWRCLQSTSIHLAELTTNYVSIQLHDYLTSYTGLQRIVLSVVHASHDMADVFFQRVLPHQSASLVELRLSPRDAGHWSFGGHNVNIFRVSSLSRLETLEITLDWTPRDSYRQLDNDLARLLNMLPRLPALRTLTIECTIDSSLSSQELSNYLSEDGTETRVMSALLAAENPQPTKQPKPSEVCSGLHA